jgi:hypothetical protein
MPQVTRESEFWTADAEGNGYCSAFSLEDAIRGHFLDMQVKINPLGPIVNVKVITRTTTVEEKTVEFWEDRYPQTKSD